MLLDDDVLIDAGTGVGDLTLDEMVRIDHVFVTHSHLDHICSIPFLVDTVGHRRNTPLMVLRYRRDARCPAHPPVQRLHLA
ncbi:MBL fold metallo-hydrolase [Undibacterium arcticum]